MSVVHTVAAQLYSVRDFCKTAEQAGETLRKLRAHGYRNVQVSGAIDALDPQTVGRLCAEAGVRIVGHHLALDTLRNHFADVVKKLQGWGCRYTAVAYLPKEERPDAAAYLARAREMSDFGRRLRAEGITLQYHNHAFEMEKYDGRTGLQILLEESDPDGLQAEIDTCWIARGGGDPAEWIRRLKGRSDQVHLKDMMIKDDQPIFTEIGSGNLNWTAVLAACREAGVKDYIVEQDSCPITQDPILSLGISYRFLATKGLA